VVTILPTTDEVQKSVQDCKAANSISAKQSWSKPIELNCLHEDNSLASPRERSAAGSLLQILVVHMIVCQESEWWAGNARSAQARSTSSRSHRTAAGDGGVESDDRRRLTDNNGIIESCNRKREVDDDKTSTLEAGTCRYSTVVGTYLENMYSYI
jgi:hypothetical protein